jgi:hypothetical protein
VVESLAVGDRDGVLKHFDALDDLKVVPPCGLIADSRLHSGHRPLRPPARLHPTSCSAARPRPTAPVRACGAGRTLAIFIDGIDEYFNKQVEDLPRAERDRRASPSLVLRAARAGRVAISCAASTTT